MITTTTTTVAVKFEDGTVLAVPSTLVARVRGLDADGDLVVSFEMTHPDGSEYRIPVTPCCFADGKGSANSATHVCCRRCHRDVAPKFGGPATVVIPVITETVSKPIYQTSLAPDASLEVESSGNVVLVTPERRITITNVARWAAELEIAWQTAQATTTP